MDILSNLKYSEGSKKSRKRVGRGVGSGHGKTSSRGHNGAGSRSGNKSRAWFEGGQMPLQRRIPKFGFTNIHKKEFQIINLGKLQEFYNKEKVDITSLTPEILFKLGIITDKKIPVKVLAHGEFKEKIDITAHKFSKSAAEKIKTNGGTVTVL